MDPDAPHRRPDAGPRLWLFPATYAVHVAEETLAGEGFPAWISRLAGVDFTMPEFLQLNAAGLALMIAAVPIAARLGREWWMAALLGTVVLLNGSAHAAASLLTQTYSPGSVSGLLLWVPLGAMTLVRSRRRLTRRSGLLATAVGAVVHGVVSILALAW
jgi:hypothetical protein